MPLFILFLPDIVFFLHNVIGMWLWQTWVCLWIIFQAVFRSVLNMMFLYYIQGTEHIWLSRFEVHYHFPVLSGDRHMHLNTWVNLLWMRVFPKWSSSFFDIPTGFQTHLCKSGYLTWNTLSKLIVSVVRSCQSLGCGGGEAIWWLSAWLCYSCLTLWSGLVPAGP